MHLKVGDWVIAYWGGENVRNGKSFGRRKIKGEVVWVGRKYAKVKATTGGRLRRITEDDVVSISGGLPSVEVMNDRLGRVASDFLAKHGVRL